MTSRLREPTSLDEAEQLHSEAVERLQAIQAQLGSRNMRVNGRRMNQEEYQGWRDRALTSLRFVSEEVRFYKSKREELRRKEADEQTREKLGIAMEALTEILVADPEEAAPIARATLRRLR